MVIDPEVVSTRQQLTDQLAALFREGAWSCQRLAAAASLSPATVLGLVNGTTGVPRPGTLKAFVEVCAQDPKAWLRARGRVVAAEKALRAAGQTADPRPTTREFFRHLIDAHMALFAGRSTETEKILAFIREQSSGYVFVEGLSGYGKTSLLAYIVNEHPEFCYHFISQVYRRSGAGFDPTNPADVLENLCEQLHPGRVATGDGVRDLELEFLGLLSRSRHTPAVVVIDGIDELAPRDHLHGLLPVQLPAGVVVVLSARTQGHRSALSDIGLSVRNLGLHLPLPGLDEAALLDLLTLAGGTAAAVAGDSDFVGRLHAVSRGDPFYLRFLVEDVAVGVLDSSNIERTPTGLEGYLDNQLAVLDRSAHRPQHVEILGFVLEAGVLSRSDLVYAVDGLTWLNFDRTVKDIHRFLLVHDDEYSFCHDRFREYFRTRV